MSSLLTKRISIIGGGASGMLAALTAAQACDGAQITLYEKNSRVGKKLLATGNGRCNITNTDCHAERFHGGDPEFVKAALARFTPDDTIDFFAQLGLMCRLTHGGRVFPYSGQASAVLDVLRFALDHAGVTVRTETAVVSAAYTDDSFRMRLQTPSGIQTAVCDKLIVSAGGSAAPSTGSDGSGFRLLAELGHRIAKPYPALTPLKTDTALAAPMRGVRVQGRVSVIHGAREAASADGEIQFTAYGLSGPAVMDVSAAAIASDEKTTVAVDLMPHVDGACLLGDLRARKARLGWLACEDFLIGIVNRKVGQAVMKRAGVEKLSLPASALDDAQIARLAQTIKKLEFTVQGHTGWEHAQATGGGADTSQFSPVTMESRLVGGLYATGEALDVYGDCGGHNLQWAWSSGRAAGLAASGQEG